jgi:hypothetical protein
MPILKISVAAIALIGGAVIFAGGNVSASPVATGAVTLAAQAEEQALAVPIQIRQGPGGPSPNVSRSVAPAPRALSGPGVYAPRTLSGSGVYAPRTLSGPIVRTSPTFSRSFSHTPRLMTRSFVRTPRFGRRGRTTIIFGGIGPIWPYYDTYPDYYYPAYYDAPDYLGGAIAYCKMRFHSYDVRSMTYLGYDGLRHPCP